MRLITRLTLATVTVIVLILGITGWTAIQRERALFRQDTVADHDVLGGVLRQILARVHQHAGQEVLSKILDEAEIGPARTQLVWFWLDGDRPPESPVELTPENLHRLHGGQNVVELCEDGDPPTVTTAMPVVQARGRTGVLVLRESLAEREAYVTTSLRRRIGVLVVILITSIPLAVVLGRWLVGRPIAELVATVRRIGEGDLEARATQRHGHELDTIAIEMGRMCERMAASQHAWRRAQEQLWHADRLATVGRLAAGLAHEMGTPLNVIAGYARLLSAQGQLDGPARDAARLIDEQAARLTRVVRDLLTFARRGETRRVTVDLSQLARSTMQTLDAVTRARGVDLVLDSDERAVMASVDVGQIQQVIVNLVVNAVDASPRPGTVRVEVRPAPAPARDVLLSVRDQGDGIPPENISKIFEPFFTTKDAGEGTGLGLAIVREIVERHGGRVEVDSKVGAGTSISIFLPAEEVA